MSKPSAIFGITRGGSSITARLVHILVKGAGWDIQDIGGTAYSNGVGLHDIPESDFAALKVENTMIGPFREMPANAGPILGTDVNKIIVFRDPRDCLVSHYFAFQNIHSSFKPGTATGLGPTGLGTEVAGVSEEIDDYMFKQLGVFKRTYMNYIEMCRATEGVMYSKYEDIAFDPLSWLAQVIDFLGISPGSAATNQAVIEACFWRVSSDSLSHNRQGQSGDFLKYLKPETIQVLNREFAEVFEFLGYSETPRMTIEQFEQASADTASLAKLLYAQRVQIDEIKRSMNNLMYEHGNAVVKIRNLENELMAK